MRTLLKFAAIGLLATTALNGAAYAKDVRVAFVPQIQGIPYYVAMENRSQGCSRQVRRHYVQQGPTATNAADQLRIFESFVNQGFNVVAVSPVDVETLKPAIARATEKGVHVITSDADAAGSKRGFLCGAGHGQGSGLQDP